MLLPIEQKGDRREDGGASGGGGSGEVGALKHFIPGLGDMGHPALQGLHPEPGHRYKLLGRFLRATTN